MVRTVLNPGVELNSLNVKKYLKYCKVPAEQSLRIDCLQKLLEVKSGASIIDGFTANDVDEIIADLCSN